MKAISSHVTVNGRTYKVPRLTPLETFVYANGHRSTFAIASETNRTEATISRVYSLAYEKMQEIRCLEKLTGLNLI